MHLLTPEEADKVAMECIEHREYIQWEKVADAEAALWQEKIQEIFKRLEDTVFRSLSLKSYKDYQALKAEMEK